MEYPKIETLFDRDETTHKVKLGEYRKPEFLIPQTWLVTEKIDGTNVRIELTSTVADPNNESEPSAAVLRFLGRTDDAKMPTFLYEYLSRTFPVDKVATAFDPGTHAILFGEGYGPRINNGGIYRTKEQGVAFRLFDVVVFGKTGRPWWLNWSNVENVAEKLGIRTVPVRGIKATLDKTVEFVKIQTSWVSVQDMGSNVGPSAEGIVARTEPLLFTRSGERLVFKLKQKDF